MVVRIKIYLKIIHVRRIGPLGGIAPCVFDACVDARAKLAIILPNTSLPFCNIMN